MANRVPPQQVYSRVTSAYGGLAPWQQIGHNLVPAKVWVQANEPLKYSPYEDLQLGNIQPYTPMYQVNSVSPLKQPAAYQPAGPFTPYPQVTNAAIVSQAVLNPVTQQVAMSAASNGLQGGVF